MLPFTSNETLLKISGVSKSYDIPILRDINLEIKNLTRPDTKQGQIISLIGKSGSGKSTLFRLIAGLESSDEGSIEVCTGMCTPEIPDGVMKPVHEGDMGVVFQTSYIYPWRRVRSILELAVDKNPEVNTYKSVSTKKQVRKEMINNLSESMDITKLMTKFVSQLSGGQRQRVAIAEQILNGGDFILMDEPFSGLDTLTIDKITKILTDLVQTDDRKTVILISHDLSNSLAISDTAFILSKHEGEDAATITHRIDLATQGLAWQPEVKENPLFRDLLKQVKSLL